VAYSPFRSARRPSLRGARPACDHAHASVIAGRALDRFALVRRSKQARFYGTAAFT
jgi:hypothetical protein